MPDSSELPKLQEIRREDLRREDAIWMLGVWAARHLEMLGQVTMLVGESDCVMMANPVHVYLDVGAVIEDGGNSELPPFTWVRPVLGSGRPQYVAWRDGQLWEVEITEKGDHDDSGEDQQEG